MKNRIEIEEKYKWDLSNYFENDEKWDIEFENVKPLYNKLMTFEDKLNNDKDILECLNLEKTINEIVSRLFVYASLKVKEDAKNSFYQNKANKLDKYLSDISPKISFI